MLEERRDLVAARYQDLPLRVRRDVRHMHANEQFVLAALLQHIHTPYAAAALPDVEAETPIAELCPRDDHLLREAKQAVGDAAVMGEDLTPVFGQIVLNKIAAAMERLDVIEAMTKRLNRSYGESTTSISERAMVLAWNLACQRIQQGVNIDAAIENGKTFLAHWPSLDDFVATKYEERRFFSFDTASLFQTGERATETTDDESETESTTSEDKTDEPARYQPAPGNAAERTNRPSFMSSPTNLEEIMEGIKRREAEEEAEKKRLKENAKNPPQLSKPETSQPTLFDTNYLQNLNVGSPQKTLQDYEDAWKAIGNGCTISELPLPLTTNNVNEMRTKLRKDIRSAHDNTPHSEREKKARLSECATCLRDGLWNDEDIIRMHTQMFVLRGHNIKFVLEKGEKSQNKKDVVYTHGKVSIDRNVGQTPAQFKTQLTAFKKHLLKEEFPRWYEDKIDQRTNCKHIEKEKRTSQVMMIKAVYNGLDKIKNNVDEWLERL